jgi:hypothetical protein
METARLGTLAREPRSGVVSQRPRYRPRLPTAHGPRQGLRGVVERGQGETPRVATWGGRALPRRQRALLLGHPTAVRHNRAALLRRLLAATCEPWGSHDRIAVPHPRHLRERRQPGRRPPPRGAQVMAARRRQTLVGWRPRHDDMQAGRPLPQRPADGGTGKPADGKRACPVWGKAEGKGPILGTAPAADPTGGPSPICWRVTSPSSWAMPIIMKAVPGRKTDVKDAEWIADL